MKKIHEIKADREKHLAHAREIAATGTAEECRAASDAVEKAQKDLIARITEGARPCPRCGEAPTGMEQPAGKGRTEYEIGCQKCKPFTHTDGTIRKASVRGGMLPRHAVDAWNEGPDMWTVA